jgi:hypothetical protein
MILQSHLVYRVHTLNSVPLRNILLLPSTSRFFSDLFPLVYSVKIPFSCISTIEDEDTMLLRNAATQLPCEAVLYPRRTDKSATLFFITVSK